MQAKRKRSSRVRAARACGTVPSKRQPTARPAPLLSGAYIPTKNLTGWLRALAEWNPISALTTALRDLSGTAPVPADAAWPVTHPVAGTPAWSAALIALAAPPAVRRYTRG